MLQDVPSDGVDDANTQSIAKSHPAALGDAVNTKEQAPGHVKDLIKEARPRDANASLFQGAQINQIQGGHYLCTSGTTTYYAVNHYHITVEGMCMRIV